MGTTSQTAGADQEIQAGKMGRLVLDDLLPQRRLRVNARDPNIDCRTYRDPPSASRSSADGLDDQPGTFATRH